MRNMRVFEVIWSWYQLVFSCRTMSWDLWPPAAKYPHPVVMEVGANVSSFITAVV